MTRNLLISLAVVVALGCKNKANEEEQNQSQQNSAASGSGQNQLPPSVPVRGQDNAKSFHMDSKVAADAIATQMDEAVASSSASEDPASAGGLGLADMGWTAEKTCAEDAAAGTATETGKLSFNMDRNFGLFGRSTQVKVSASEDISRSWKKEGEPMKCANSRSFKRPENMKGVVMDSNFTRSMSRTVASSGQASKQSGNQGAGLGGILGTLLGDLFKESKSTESKGKRKISWTADESVNGVRTEKQTVETDTTKKVTRSTDKGEISYETSVKSKDGDPMVIEVVKSKMRLFSMALPESKLISSGTLISVRKDGSRIESHYDKVKYDFKKAGCFPVSGKITGEIFATTSTSQTKGADPTPTATPAATPSPTSPPQNGSGLTFTIDFSANEPVIEFSNGKKEPFIPMGCDFEDLSAAVHWSLL